MLLVKPSWDLNRVLTLTGSPAVLSPIRAMPEGRSVLLIINISHNFHLHIYIKLSYFLASADKKSKLSLSLTNRKKAHRFSLWHDRSLQSSPWQQSLPSLPSGISELMEFPVIPESRTGRPSYVTDHIPEILVGCQNLHWKI